jgi:hypothetical protein
VIDEPRVIVATSGRREGEAKRTEVRLMAKKDGEVWTALEVYDGIRCLDTRVLHAGTDAKDAAIAGRVFNETVRALSADGIAGLEEIPADYGYEIAEAAAFVLRSGQQPHLDAAFALSDEDLEAFGREATHKAKGDDGASS